MGLKDGFGLNGGGSGGGGGVPYKSYVAMIYKNPNTATAPVLTQLVNELGATITCLMVSNGSYYIHADAPVFTLGKTLLHVEAASDEGDRITNYIGTPFTTTDLFFINYDATGGSGSIYGLLHGAWVEIRVYP